MFAHARSVCCLLSHCPFQPSFGRKRRRDSDDVSDGGSDGGAGAAVRPEIAAFVESAAGVAVAELDGARLAALISNLEQAAATNAEQRARHAHDPKQYMASELALDEAITALEVLGSYPSLFRVLIERQAATLLLGLIAHANEDVSCDVLELLAGLTDAEGAKGVPVADPATRALLAHLVANSLIELAGANLARMAASEETGAKCIQTTLTLFETLVEWEPAMQAEIPRRAANLFGFLMQLIGAGDKTDTAFYAAEILAVLLHGCPANWGLFLAGNCLEPLLNVLAGYKKVDPDSADEREAVENLYDALCSLLVSPEAQDAFRSLEGIELMLLVVKHRKFARKCALRALDFALAGSAPACEAFASAGGIGIIFGVLMHVSEETASAAKANRRGYGGDADEKHACAVIVQLFTSGAVARERLVAKFVESDYAKLERLVELRAKYGARVAAVDAEVAHIARLAEMRDNDDDDDDAAEALAAELYERRLDAGLFTLQLIDLLLVLLCANAHEYDLRDQIVRLLGQKRIDVASVAAVLEEYAAQQAPEGGAANGEDDEGTTPAAGGLAGIIRAALPALTRHTHVVSALAGGGGGSRHS